MQEVVAYVLAKDGSALMPMHSYGRVRKLLKSNRAVVKSRVPYVIQLTYEISGPIYRDAILGIDPGRTNAGFCTTDIEGDVLHAANVLTRNKEIPDLMQKRAMHRDASRAGERKRRQRRAIKNNTCFKEGTERQRILPKCEKPITVKHITNTEARFCNRKREEGWLTPTANQCLQTILNEVRQIKRILPITKVAIELNKFDFAKMENPDIKAWEYGKGKLYGYNSVEEAVYDRQNGRCIFCDKHIEHYHHAIPKHLGGSEFVDNRAGVCAEHHHLVHTDTRWEKKLKKELEGQTKKYNALSVINQIMPKLIEELSKEFEVYITTGYETKKVRDAFGLDKDHCIDAWCIAASVFGFKKMPKFKPYTIKQFRRQNRAIINHQTERTYRLDGKMVAKNRNKRIEQKEDSLHEWYEKQVAKFGEEKAKELLKQLDVTKSTRYYNTENRLMPGAVFEYEGKRLVLSGQLSGGQYYRAVGDSKTNYPAKKCRILTQNTGLVYL